jgi:hypothetical protein
MVANKHQNNNKDKLLGTALLIQRILSDRRS